MAEGVDQIDTSGPGAREYTRYRWVIQAQIWIHFAVGHALFQAFGLLLPSLRDEFGIGPVAAGFLGSLRSIGQFLTFPASLLLVRFRPNRSYGVLFAIAAAAALVQGVAPTLAVLALSMAIYALAVSWTLIPGAFIRLRWIPPTEMATSQGVGMAAQGVGQIIVFTTVPLLLNVVEWRGVVIAFSILLASFALIWFSLQRDRPNTRTAGVALGQTRDTIKLVLRRPVFWLLGLCLTGGAGAYVTTVTFLPSYLTGERGMSLALAGAILSAVPIGGLIASLSSGFLSDRLGRRKPFIWSAGLALPPLYLLLVSPVPEFALWPIAFGVGYFAFAPFGIVQTLPFEMPGLTPREVAVGQSLVLTLATVGPLTAPVIAGLVASRLDYKAGILAVAILPVTFALACLFLPETGPAAQRGRPTA